MACCERVGGSYSPGKAAKVLPENSNAFQMINGQPYHITELNFRNAMPIPFLAIAGGAQAGLNAIKGGAVARAESGQTVTAPKTIAGKILGGITGRNEAAQISQSMQAARANAPVSPAVEKTLRREGIPVSGGLQFGKAENDRQFLTRIAVIAGAAVVAVVYFLNPKKRKRR